MPDAAGLMPTGGSMLTFLMYVVALIVLATVLASFYSIGPTQIGLVRKRFGRKLPGDNPLAFLGEAGYQADLLMPGCASSSSRSPQ